MNCPYCGSELEPGAKFCEHCGAKVVPQAQGQAGAEPENPFEEALREKRPENLSAGAPEPENPFEEARKSSGSFISEDGVIKGSRVTENIYLCPDGKYRWVYELNMMKNPAILITVYKVLLIAIGVVWLFMVIVNLATDSMYGFTGFLKMTGFFLALVLAFAVTGFIAYAIVAASYGWNYAVYFEMDEKSVSHIQMPKQYKKAEVLGWITVLAGLTAGSYTTAGAGLLAQGNDRRTSEFRNVEQIVERRRSNLIKVNQKLNYNQVYAEDADFDFVWDYITSRCTKAKIK